MHIQLLVEVPSVKGIPSFLDYKTMTPWVGANSLNSAQNLHILC